MRNLLKTTTIIISIVILASGCGPVKTYKESEQAISDAAQTMQQTRMPEAPVPAVITRSGYYVDTTPNSLEKQPTWLKDPITLQGQDLPLQFYVSRLLSKTNASANYQPDMHQNKMLSINYTGTIKGALDKLAEESGYAYQVQDNKVNWSSLVTKTLNISFMPGSATYLVGQTANSTHNSNQDNSQNNGVGGSTNLVTTRGNLDDEQYSNLQATLSIWKDIKTTLNDLKSPDGKVIVSESTTSVTVSDHPENVQVMEQYINQLNKEMTQQVSIQVQVLEVELKKEFNYGINWNLVQDALGTQIGFAGNLANAANIGGNANTVDAGVSLLRIGRETGSNAVIQALSQQGELSVVTRPRVVTMNNQMAEIRITKDTGYLQSVSTSTIANASGTSTSLTPGIVTDGFTLYLLPKIKGSDIYLQISSTLSTLTALEKVDNTVAGKSANSTDFQAIQVPTLTEKRFNQRTMVQSGSTLVVAGFKQLRDEIKENAPYGITPLGGAGGQKQNVETIVLITPTVIRNPT